MTVDENRMQLRKEVIKKIQECSACPHFQNKRLFGIVPAYCLCGGRALRSNHPGNLSFAEFVIHGADVYFIPKWCPLPDEKLKERCQNDRR